MLLLFCISLQFISIHVGLWSEIHSSYSPWYTEISCSSIPIVATISMLVFFYLSPNPFLVHPSVSLMFHPSISASIFHVWYEESSVSVLMSRYTIYGNGYFILRLYISSITLSHFLWLLPFSACTPAKSHYVRLPFRIISAICLWSLRACVVLAVLYL